MQGSYSIEASLPELKEIILVTAPSSSMVSIPSLPSANYGRLYIFKYLLHTEK
jgi:hypothetical protein